MKKPGEEAAIRQKLKNTNAFTLAELLIVVAIIGILVAVSIPIFRGQLEKARARTDIANERAAKAAAVASYLTDNEDGGEKVYYYDAVNGTVSETPPAAGFAGYGKSSVRPEESLSVSSSPAPRGGYVSVTVKDSSVSLTWAGGSGASGGSGSGSGGSGGSVGGSGGGPVPSVTTAEGGLLNPDGTVTSWDELTNLVTGNLKHDGGYHLGQPDATWAIIGVRDKTKMAGSLAIKESITEVTSEVFKGASGLTEVKFPSSFRVIGQRAFQGSGLTSVVIPDGIREIGEGAFSSLANLETIEWHYNSTPGAYSSSKYLFSGSSSPAGKIKIVFYGTEEQFDSLKSKLSLPTGGYEVEYKAP